MKRILLASLLTAVAFGAVGCAKLKLPSLPRLWGTKAPAPTDVAVDPAEVPPWTPYPSDAVLGEDWDIVVTKARGELVLTNRAPRSFRNVQVWLNRQYVAEAKLIRIGSGNRIPLHREGKPEDVAAAILSLVQNEYITGEMLVIDGGLTSRIA